MPNEWGYCVDCIFRLVVFVCLWCMQSKQLYIVFGRFDVNRFGTAIPLHSRKNYALIYHSMCIHCDCGIALEPKCAMRLLKASAHWHWCNCHCHCVKEWLHRYDWHCIALPPMAFQYMLNKSTKSKLTKNTRKKSDGTHKSENGLYNNEIYTKIKPKKEEKNEPTQQIHCSTFTTNMYNRYNYLLTLMCTAWRSCQCQTCDHLLIAVKHSVQIENGKFSDS